MDFLAANHVRIVSVWSDASRGHLRDSTAFLFVNNLYIVLVLLVTSPARMHCIDAVCGGLCNTAVAIKSLANFERVQHLFS